MLEIEKQGKIKGRGTMPRQKAGLHKGWRGTRFESHRACGGTDHVDSLNTSPTVRVVAISASPELPR